MTPLLTNLSFCQIVCENEKFYIKMFEIIVCFFQLLSQVPSSPSPLIWLSDPCRVLPSPPGPEDQKTALLRWQKVAGGGDNFPVFPSVFIVGFCGQNHGGYWASNSDAIAVERRGTLKGMSGSRNNWSSVDSTLQCTVGLKVWIVGVVFSSEELRDPFMHSVEGSIERNPYWSRVLSVDSPLYTL